VSDDTIIAAIATLRADIAERFDRVERKVDGLEQKFDGLEQKVDGLEQKFDGLEQKFDGLEQKFDGLEQKVDRQGEAHTSLRVAVFERFDRVETQLTQLRDDITVNLAGVDRAYNAADNARADIKTLAFELSTLTRKTRRLEAQVNDLMRPS
jgi:chromosome segregation ATPase